MCVLHVCALYVCQSLTVREPREEEEGKNAPMLILFVFRYCKQRWMQSTYNLYICNDIIHLLNNTQISTDWIECDASDATP